MKVSYLPQLAGILAIGLAVANTPATGQEHPTQKSNEHPTEKRSSEHPDSSSSSEHPEKKAKDAAKSGVTMPDLAAAIKQHIKSESKEGKFQVRDDQTKEVLALELDLTAANNLAFQEPTTAMSEIQERGYAHPDTLVSTEWVAQHLNDPSVRIIESNEDSLLYPSGHIPGAVEVNWTRDLNDQLRRDYLGKVEFEALMSRIGATPDTTLVLYGDKSNWWASYAYWVFQLFGHRKAKIMDGGRLKWEQENRPLSREVKYYPVTNYSAPDRNDMLERIFRDGVLAHVREGKKLVDVRSPEEFSGEKLHMDGYPNEGALRGGHIPGARSIPWSRAVNPADGTFKSASELREIYGVEAGLKTEDEIVTYCRIGERSSVTWFVLKELLGYPKVRNYDGSWVEWGNLVGVPIEK